MINFLSLTSKCSSSSCLKQQQKQKQEDGKENVINKMDGWMAGWNLHNVLKNFISLLFVEVEL